MEVVKICRFCGEQIKGEAVKCRFCGEFVGNRVRVVRRGGTRIGVDHTAAGPGPRPPRQPVEPVEFISGDRIGVIQVLSVISAIWIFVVTVGGVADGENIIGLASLGGMVSWFLAWILLLVLLRRFTGTRRIAVPLLSMVILYGAVITLLLVMASRRAAMLPEGFYYVGGITVIGCMLAGFICYLVAAARMISARSYYLPLRGLGRAMILSSVVFIFVSLIISTIFNRSATEGAVVWVCVLGIIKGLAAAWPMLALFVTLWKCRCRLPDDIISDNIIESQ
ncbi:MAG: hypothetical protein LIO77_05275 [Rikenellaceae bacterium]|nr:hypothetical protein [Rikenellaceae bacterium]